MKKVTEFLVLCAALAITGCTADESPKVDPSSASEYLYKNKSLDGERWNAGPEAGVTKATTDGKVSVIADFPEGKQSYVFLIMKTTPGVKYTFSGQIRSLDKAKARLSVATYSKIFYRESIDVTKDWTPFTISFLAEKDSANLYFDSRVPGYDVNRVEFQSTQITADLPASR